jgi:hypothetical protein
MLDNQTLERASGSFVQIPLDYVDAVKDLPVQDLMTIEKEIAYYEATGILKGRALTVMKSLQVEKPKRKSQRPTLLIA